MARIEVTADDNRLMFDVLTKAFTASSLTDLIDASVPEIAGEFAPAGIKFLVPEVVRAANRHGVLDRFLVDASKALPNRPDLWATVLIVSQRKGWAVQYIRDDHPSEGLERLTSQGNPFLDVSRLARWMIGVESQVCQVRSGQGGGGTGFLIAPDLVLTNYHVVESHLNGSVPISEVQVRFDFRVSPAGVAPDENAPWEDIDPTWAIPNRPYSQADLTLAGDPAATELDYAILRLKRKAGEEVLANGKRGWVDVSKDQPLPPAEAPILIVQHPGQPPQGTLPLQPLKISFATPGFERSNANNTRVAYKPSTLKGSSGSPVFGPDYRAVALHHNRGQISDAALNLDRNNRGIPLSTIRADLRSRTDLAVNVLGMLIAPPGA